MKRKYLFIGLTVILILAVLLWFIGGVVQNRREKDNLAYYQRLIEEHRNIESLVERNLSFRGLVNLPEENEVNEIEQFGLNDMRIFSDLTEENIRHYGREIARVLRPYSQERDNEVLLVLEALSTQNPQMIRSLENTKNIHQTAVENLKQISVPQDAQVVHLRLINNIYQLQKQIEKMANVLNDPAEALQNSEKYIRGQVNFFRAVEGINVYFFRHGIIFSDSEGIDIYDSVGVIARPD